MPTNNIKKVIGLINNGKEYPVLSLVREDPGMAATISKLITSPEPPRYGNAGNREITEPNTYNFKNTSEHISQNIADAKTVLQILPDMELSAQILISSILAPKDMVTTELTYALPDGIMTPEISSALINRVKQCFEQDYKIKPLLPKMLRDILFETGSYAVAVIPENSIDELINGARRITMESISGSLNSDGTMKPIGLLGPAYTKDPKAENDVPGVSLEAFNSKDPATDINAKVTLESEFGNPVDTYLSVTDNHNLLKVPRINQKLREQRTRSLINSKALESIDKSISKLTDREMSGLIYKEKNFNFKPLNALKTQEQLNRYTVGNPLVIHLPSESVIPVYVPGCSEEQIGFFVLIDADGNPVSRAEDADYYQQLSSRLNSNGSFPSAMLARVKSQMSGFNPSNREGINYMSKIYGEMIEQDLLSRLRNGIYGNGVALAKREEVYRVMLSRALAKQHTQLLFIPIELMTYMAFKYTEDGIGKSLLDEMKVLNSLRSMVLFANVMASLKNSIGRTEVKVKLDESDPNPQKTIELTMHEIIRSRQQYFPLGVNSPTDLTDWLMKSGFEFTFEGHPGIPDVRVDFGEKNSNYVKPDNDLEDNLRKKAIMATGLSPESVDASYQAEFATSILTNNVLLSKRVVQLQEQFTPQLSNNLRKYIMHSESTLNDLRKILETNYDKLNPERDDKDKSDQVDEKSLSADADKKYDNEFKKDGMEFSEENKNAIINMYLNEFLMNFEVTLAKPNSVTLENQVTAMETYTKALDAALDAWINDRFFNTDVGGEVASQVNTIKEVIRAYYLRKWMAENGVLPELAELTTAKHDGTPTVDVYALQQEHISSLTKSLTQFMVGINKVKEASNTVIQSIGGAGEGADSYGGDNSSSDTSGGGSSSDEDEFGIPGIPDMNLDENPSSEEESSEESSTDENNTSGNESSDNESSGTETNEKPSNEEGEEKKSEDKPVI